MSTILVIVCPYCGQRFDGATLFERVVVGGGRLESVDVCPRCQSSCAVQLVAVKNDNRLGRETSVTVARARAARQTEELLELPRGGVVRFEPYFPPLDVDTRGRLEAITPDGRRYQMECPSLDVARQLANARGATLEEEPVG